MPGTRVDGGEFWSAIASGAIAALISPKAAQKGVEGGGQEGSLCDCSWDVTSFAQVASALWLPSATTETCRRHRHEW